MKRLARLAAVAGWFFILSHVTPDSKINLVQVGPFSSADACTDVAEGYLAGFSGDEIVGGVCYSSSGDRSPVHGPTG